VSCKAKAVAIAGGILGGLVLVVVALDRFVLGPKGGKR